MLKFMIQTLNYLTKVCEEYNKLFQKIEFVPVQKAFIGPHYLNLVLRFPGKSLNLLLGLGERHEGIELSESSIPGIIRQRDRFLDYVRKNIVGGKIGKIQVDPNFRRVRLTLIKQSKLNYFDLMWIERDLYFSWQEQVEESSWLHFCSWKGEFTNNHSINLKDVFSEFTQQKDPQGDDKEFSYFSMKTYLKNVLSGTKVAVNQSKSKKFLSKKIKNITSDIERFKKRDIFKNQLLADQLNLESTNFDLCGVKIKFKSEDSYYQRKNILFNKIKNLDSVEIKLEERLQEAMKAFEKSENKVQEDKIKLMVTQPVWGNNKENIKKKVVSSAKSDFRILTYELPSKIRVRVSLDAKSNDELRAQSSKDHLWFHQEIGAGAHLVAKTDRFDQLTSEDLILIASILHHYSKLSGSELSVMYATIKELKGQKGSPGKVLVKKPKYLTLLIDQNWREKSIEVN